MSDNKKLISKQLEDYYKIIKAIKKQHYKYIILVKQFNKDNPRPMHPTDDYERKVYEFDKGKLKPITEKIEKLQQKKREFDANFSVSVRFGDLVDEIKKLSKTKVLVDIDTITYPWGKLKCEQLNDIVRKSKYVPHFDILIYNKSYTTNPKLYFKKSNELNCYTKFCDDSKISDNVFVDSGENSATITIKKPDNLMINFSAKDLIQENESWAPVALIRKAVINIVENKPIM